MNLLINKEFMTPVSSALLLLSLIGILPSMALGQGSKKVNNQPKSSSGSFKKASLEVSKTSQLSRVFALKSQGGEKINSNANTHTNTNANASTNSYSKTNHTLNSNPYSNTNINTRDVAPSVTTTSQSIKSELSAESNTIEGQDINNGLIYPYRSKFKTSLSFYVAGGSFNATAEEDSSSYSEAGLALEVGGRESDSSLRLDLNTKTRSTESGALSVKNDFREYRVFYKHSFLKDSNKQAYQPKADFSLFIGLGLGTLVPKSHFRLGSSSKTIESQAYLLQAAMAGMSLSFNSGIFFDFFAQSSFASPYPKGSLTSLGIDVGASF